jgi:hypothetical protein
VPFEAKPLFRPDVLRTHLSGFKMPDRVQALRPRLDHWADLIASHRIGNFNEQQILSDFLTDFVVMLLGYSRPVDGSSRYTIGREEHVAVDGKVADAMLGNFNGERKIVVALEGKGPCEPLDHPFAGRHMSAFDQGYRSTGRLRCEFPPRRKSWGHWSQGRQGRPPHRDFSAILCATPDRTGDCESGEKSRHDHRTETVRSVETISTLPLHRSHRDSVALHGKTF